MDYQLTIALDTISQLTERNGEPPLLSACKLKLLDNIASTLKLHEIVGPIRIPGRDKTLPLLQIPLCLHKY